MTTFSQKGAILSNNPLDDWKVITVSRLMQRGLADIISLFLQEGAILCNKPLDDFKLAIARRRMKRSYSDHYSLFARGSDPVQQATGRLQDCRLQPQMQRSLAVFITFLQKRAVLRDKPLEDFKVPSPACYQQEAEIRS